MTNNERLSRELRNRADQTGGHPISFDDVKRSATKMKWQQRAAAGVVATVVLAIGVPVGFAVVNSNGSTDGTPPVATESPDPTPAEPTPSPVVNPDGSIVLRLDGAPAGEAPAVGWMQGTTLHLPDGTEVTLPQQYGDVISYDGHWYGEAVQAFQFDDIVDGQVTRSVDGGGFAVSADGEWVSWFEQVRGGPGKLQVRMESDPRQDRTVEIPQGMIASPVVLLGNRVVYRLDNLQTGDRSVWYADDERGFEIEGGSTGIGGGTPDGGVALQTKVSDDGSCWAIYSFGGGETPSSYGKETCDYSLGEFSSDGKYVIGWPAYADGWGPGEVAILDAKTFKPVVRFDSGKDYGVSHAVWDGESNSLIAIVYLDGVYQLVRLGLDGSIVTASEPVEADDMSNPFQLVSDR